MKIAFAVISITIDVNANATQIGPAFGYNFLPSQIINEENGGALGCSPMIGNSSLSYLSTGTFTYTGPGNSGSQIKQVAQVDSGISTIITNLPSVPMSGPSKWTGKYSSDMFLLSTSDTGYKINKATKSGKVEISLKYIGKNYFSGTIYFEPNNNGLKCKLLFFAY